MDVLLIGKASSFLQLLVNKLDKEGCRIFLLTEETKKVRGYRKVFETYRFAYDSACVADIFESVKPDVVIFTGAFDKSFRWSDARNASVTYASGLMNILMAFSTTGKGRFIYLSSEIVFQKSTVQVVETEKPYAVYTPKGQSIAMGEEMCLKYADMFQLDVVVLRMDHMYGIPNQVEETDNICAQMCIEALDKQEITVERDKKICLLYAADAIEFIYRVMEKETHEKSVYQISSGQQVLELELAQLIKNAFKGEITIAEQVSEKKNSVILSNQDFENEFGIRIFHRPEQIVPQLAAYIFSHASEFANVSNRVKTFREKWNERTRGFLTAVIPFVENLICFVPFFMLNNRAVGSEYFSNIDFYLLYVLLFGIVYGQQQATFASLLAVAGYCFRQMYQRSGFDVMLDYNTYIWIAQLLILGLAVGYMRDQLKAVREEKAHEVRYLSRQLDDISDINVSNVRVKEILSDQIVNQNDSFGKIYEITSSLDKYEPEEVLFYAAEVLAQLMGSKDVAIYSVANRSYARLFSATSPKARSLGNSIQYQKMTEMYDTICEKKVYINKNMNEEYPLMANAIYAEDEMQLILMIWGIPWERMTLGQANLLTITGYLIQNAVLRANRYMAALEQQRYVEGTSILEAEAFGSLVKAYLTAKRKKLTECTMICIETRERQDAEISEALKPMVRQTDYLGRLSDGNLYALLANTNSQDAEFVKKRFREAGFLCEVWEDVAL